jgi:curved DNA-binding protein CbpA
MDNRIDYYDVLGVAPDAEPEVIRAAYRALAKKYHPDGHLEGKAEAEKKLQELNEAYEVLSSSVYRSKYDKERSAGLINRNSGDANQTENTRVQKDYGDWTVFEKRYPEVGFKYKQLLKISHPLAEAYRSRIIRERAFARYDQISSELINQFASRYFGSNKTIQQFGLWCLSNSKREVARELNMIIATNGTPQNPSEILSQLQTKHQIPAKHAKPVRRRRVNSTSFPTSIRLALIAVSGVAIAILALSWMLTD